LAIARRWYKRFNGFKRFKRFKTSKRFTV